MTVINAAMITIVVPGKGTTRFAPQALATDPTQPSGSMAFPLVFDPNILTEGANSTITVVPSIGDAVCMTNISVNVDHYGDGTHQIVGNVDAG